MTFEEYQEAAAKTATYPHRNATLGWVYPATGLAEEAGEVAGKFAKVVRDDNWVITPGKKREIIKELGDVLWMVSAICDELNVSMAYVADLNIEKLTDRAKRGVIGGSGDNR